MRYIEINTREIYLRQDPALGLVLRGEIPECGPSCHANLSKLFLEYAMSCKGYEDSSVMLESVELFGEQLGAKVASKFLTQYQGKSSQEIVPIIFDCVLASMEGQYRKESTNESLKIAFLESPLAITAGKNNLHLWVSPAFQGFVAFFESILNSVGGGWTLLSPKLGDSNASLQEISLKNVALSPGE
jgi:hypothetical protein